MHRFGWAKSRIGNGGFREGLERIEFELQWGAFGRGSEVSVEGMETAARQRMAAAEIPWPPMSWKLSLCPKLSPTTRG